MNEHQTSILQASALDLQQRLTDGSLTSVALTTLLLDQVERHNHCGLKLNAVISLAPRDNVLAAARSLDLERRAGVTRSKLHGIPIIVKVDIFQRACCIPSKTNLSVGWHHHRGIVGHADHRGIARLCRSQSEEKCRLGGQGAANCVISFSGTVRFTN